MEKLRKERIGETSINKQGIKMEIIEYNKSNDIVVKFENGHKLHTTYASFKNKTPRYIENHNGEENFNTQGSLMKIIGYKDTRNVIVEFQDEHKHISKTSYYAFKRGEIINPYFPSLFNVGYIGKCYYDNKKYSYSESYKKWFQMLRRCYDINFQKNSPTYVGCTVCVEWHNYSNFNDWYNENYYEIPNEIMCLDKDILVNNNRIYSPSSCIFVPTSINNLFTSKTKNNNFGISIREKDKGLFFPRYGGKNLGSYKNFNDAKEAYLIEKQKSIRSCAEKYKFKIPNILYEKLSNYEERISNEEI